MVRFKAVANGDTPGEATDGRRELSQAFAGGAPAAFERAVNGLRIGVVGGGFARKKEDITFWLGEEWAGIGASRWDMGITAERIGVSHPRDTLRLKTG